MTIEETMKIDAAHEKDGVLILEIHENGATKNPNKRLELLLDKLRTYISYIGSNEFKRLSSLDSKKANIVVISKTPATEEMKKVKFFGLKDEHGAELLKIPVSFETK